MTSKFELMADVAVLAKSGQTMHLSTTNEQLAVTAKRVGAQEVQKFEADFTADIKKSGVYLVRGSFTADVTQVCVRTLAPVKTSVKDSFIVTFMAEKKYTQFLEDEEEGTLEDVELLSDDKINLAEIAIQFLSLSLDPYPVSDEVLEEKNLGDKVTIKSEDQHRQETSPFAVLKKLDKKG